MRLESAIRDRREEQRRLGIELDATCRICLRAKFADGVGYLCNYCGTRCCASCGGKVSLRSNKVIILRHDFNHIILNCVRSSLNVQTIWVCILCRKKQEFLIKTGQWMHSSMASRMRQLEAETPLESSTRPEFDKWRGSHPHLIHPPPLQRALSLEHEPSRRPSVHHHQPQMFPADRRGSLGLPATCPFESVRPSLRRQWSQENSMV